MLKIHWPLKSRILTNALTFHMKSLSGTQHMALVPVSKCHQDLSFGKCNRVFFRTHQVTPQKSNIDANNGHILKESIFSKPSFWVSMFVFVGVCHLIFGLPLGTSSSNHLDRSYHHGPSVIPSDTWKHSATSGSFLPKVLSSPHSCMMDSILASLLHA